MLGKARRNVRRGAGSDPLAKTGLSDDRLALVHRYMLHAEEAEAEQQAATETKSPEAEPPRIHPERELRVEEVFTRASTSEPQIEKVGVDEPRERLSRAERRAAKEAARRIAALEKKEARERKALAKAAARRKR